MPRLDSEWAVPPRWVCIQKHNPRNILTLGDAITESAKFRAGKYIIGREHVEAMEIGAVSARDENGRSVNELQRPHDNVRVFWHDAGRIIGASNGTPTQYIYVIYCVNGYVHGYPITPQELRKAGVNI